MSANVPYMGYVDSVADLGLPDLPYLNGTTDLLDGTTDQYVWYRSPASWRADDVTGTSESDIYQVGQVTYMWDYEHGLFSKITGAQPVRLPRAADLLPPALARGLLRTAAASDRLRRLPSRRIAGIDAAGLQVTPGGRRTTIGSIGIWADPRTGLPVQVQITGLGASRPALTTSFLDLSLRRPRLSVVTPHPAPGITVATARPPNVAAVLNGDGGGMPFPRHLGYTARADILGLPSGLPVYGAGFSKFVLFPLPARAGSSALNAAANAGAAAVSVADQTGALMQTPLLNVLLISAGFGRTTFVLVGAVRPPLLENAASSLVADLNARFRTRR